MKQLLCIAMLLVIGLHGAAGGRLEGNDRIEIAPEVLTAQQQRIEAMRRASAATVAVFGLDGGGGGSGVLISPDGFALTNYHVSSACGDHMRCGLNDGRMYDAVIVGVDAVGDVSLIQLLGRQDFPTAPMGDSDQIQVGQWCFSAGNPFGLAANRQPSVSLGIISGKNRYQYPAGTILEYADCIQTDAAVNPGNSGGPLFNLAGEIIGINGRCSFEKRGRVNVGVGYAISINQIRTFLSMLKSGRLLDHATLGATVATDDAGRVLVSNILSNSDAYRRGLRYGDEVLRFADREVNTTNAFKNILGTLPKDLRVPIEIRREGKNQTLLVRLVGVHTSSQLIKIVEMGLDGEPKESKPKPKDNQPKGEQPKDGQPKPAQPGGEADEHDANELSDAESSEERDSETGQLLPGVPDTKLVASMLETRPGFANYYYNRLKRQEIAKQLVALGDYSKVSALKLKGKLLGESTPVELAVGTESMELIVGSRRSQYKGDISDVVAERRQGGLAVAVRALKELLQNGPEKIGETVYLGQLPVYSGMSMKLSEQPWHDVLETSWYDAKVRFCWDEKSQQVSLVEVFGDDGTDPAELYLDNYKRFVVGDETCQFPSRLRLQYGTEILLVVEVEGLEASGIAASSPGQSAAGKQPDPPSAIAPPEKPADPATSTDNPKGK